MEEQQDKRAFHFQGENNRKVNIREDDVDSSGALSRLLRVWNRLLASVCPDADGRASAGERLSLTWPVSVPQAGPGRKEATFRSPLRDRLGVTNVHLDINQRPARAPGWARGPGTRVVLTPSGT